MSTVLETVVPQGTVANTSLSAIQTFKLGNSQHCQTRKLTTQDELDSSATAVGANYREANRAESRSDFVHKIAVAADL